MKPQVAHLQYAVDWIAIQDVLTRYLRGVDRGDEAMITNCFSEDAKATFNDETHLRGLKEIGDFLTGRDRQGAPPAVAGLKLRTHFSGDTLIDILGDSARTETYAISYLVRSDEPTDLIMVRGLRYLNSLARREGRWLIVDLLHTLDWSYLVSAAFSKDLASRTQVRWIEDEPASLP